MSNPIVGTNCKLEIEKTIGAAITVTALTKANPGVATATGHGLANGDVIKFSVAEGMVELDGQAVRVSAVDTDTFTLEGYDTSTYSEWTEGEAKKVTAWSTFATSQRVSMPDPTPNRADVTCLIHKTKQYIYLLPDAPEGQVSGLFNPSGEAETLIKAATKSNSALAFRITFSSGLKAIFNAFVSGGSGFELETNAAATEKVAFTPRNDVMYYAS